MKNRLVSRELPFSCGEEACVLYDEVENNLLLLLLIL